MAAGLDCRPWLGMASVRLAPTLPTAPWGARVVLDPGPQGRNLMSALDMTAADRCDRCGAQAWVRVWVNADALSTLDFCKHHFEQHEERLVAGGAIFADHRDRINAQLDVSA